MSVGLAPLKSNSPKHVDNTNILIYPFWRGGSYVLDYRCPMEVELEWLGLRSLARLSRLWMPSAIRRAEVLIAVNQRMLRHASRQADVKRRYVVPNYPLKSFRISITQEEARRKLGIDEAAPMAVFVGGGRLREIYGIDLLLKTWIEVARSIQGVRLAIVGNVNQLEYTKNETAKLENFGVTFAGRVDNSEVPYWIAASDVCLSQRTPGFPSQFYDVYDSIKLSEYAIFEKPIVAAGYSRSEDYLSPRADVGAYSNSIIRAFRGHAPLPVPHTWEENLSIIKEVYSHVL
jgi:glycosyltransferase involved in cell wall biosynthesis